MKCKYCKGEILEGNSICCNCGAIYELNSLNIFSQEIKRGNKLYKILAKLGYTTRRFLNDFSLLDNVGLFLVISFRILWLVLCLYAIVGTIFLEEYLGTVFLVYLLFIGLIPFSVWKILVEHLMNITKNSKN